eukprot:COSAG06_NODE_3678_length_5024_cov_10.529137_3_plen_55_part_00
MCRLSQSVLPMYSNVQANPLYAARCAPFHHHRTTVDQGQFRYSPTALTTALTLF